MYEILKKEKIADNTYLMQILAPEVAKKAQAGNFIILRIDEKGERIPLTIAGFDKKSITIVFLVVGKTTEQLSRLRKGDSILDFTGPLGNKTEIEEFGTVCLVGGGLGIAPIYPIAAALKKRNNIITIVGAKTKKALFWQDRFKSISDELVVCTDDGSCGKKGFVTAALKELMENTSINRIIAIGPPIMMKTISDLTKDRIKTIVSLNPIMVDGMGMCGCCRVVVDSKVRFACVDGPEFDGHKVDWKELMDRNRSYACEEESCRGHH